MTIFILIMIIIIVAASFAFAPSAAPQKAQPPSSEFELPEGYVIIAPPQKPKAAPKKPEESFVYIVWNIIMGVVFILVLLSLLLVR